jgi:integrase
MGRIPSKNKNLPPHMRARTQRSGRTFYYYDTGAKPRVEIPLGDDYVLAVKKWSELESEKSTRFAKLVTFRYVAERYMREIIPTKAPRTQRDNLIELEFLFSFFDEPPAPIAEIEPVHIRHYMDWRVKKSAAQLHEKNRIRTEKNLPPLEITGKEGQVRANREKALFSHIFNMARNWGLTTAQNPCAGITGYSEIGRDIYVEDIEYKKVWEAADQPTRDAMDLAYLTGQRPSDTLGYDETDIRDGFLIVQQGKTRKKLRITITGELAILIERILARKRSYESKVVFTQLIVNERGGRLTLHALQQRFDKARELAGVDKSTFQFRDLRAKAGTDKTDSSGDIRQAQKQLGHRSLTMTETYVRNRKGDKVGPTK